ncbi:MAG: NlpC/P60 family protein [Methanogenium sp.]|jgi:proteasome lid subunit RPN8/RPN11
MKKYFDDTITQQAILHAQECYPNESCGIIHNNTYIRCNNVSYDKSHNFRISNDELFPYIKDRNIQAIIHSHCDNNRPLASKDDIQMQTNSGIPWGIVDLVNRSVRNVFFWGDQLPIQDLLGRPFIYGVYDCFGLVRDYYRMHGKTIPNYPREWNWWSPDENGVCGNDIMDHLEDGGFSIISVSELKPGDVIIGKVQFDTPNHCGIYLGSTVMHHWCMRGSLSCEIPYNTISKYIIHGARYNEKV